MSLITSFQPPLASTKPGWAADVAMTTSHVSQLVVCPDVHSFGLPWLQSVQCVPSFVNCSELWFHIQCYYIRWPSVWRSDLVSCPDPPEKWKVSLVFWTTFLVTWGGVKWRKECNYCISHALHGVTPPCVTVKSFKTPNPFCARAGRVWAWN